MQDTEQAKQHVLDRFKKRGFHHLTLEELAVTQICPTWASDFKNATSEEWSAYQEKAVDRLSRAKFNLKWQSREETGSFSSLFSIVSRGDLKTLEEYLRINSLEACVHATDDSNKTCLHISCREGHSDLVEYLLNNRWDIEARDKMMSTPLHQACSAGHAKIVSFLLRKGADPRSKDSLGRNSLLYAVCSPNTEAVEALLKQDPGLIESKDHTGRSSLHYAVFNPHPRQVDIARTLLEAGISVDVPDYELKTPLHHACEACKPRGIRLLMKWGANTQSRDKSGKIPADLASNQNVKQLVTLYVKTKTEEIPKSSRLSSEKLPRLGQRTGEARAATPVLGVSQPPSNYREKLVNLLRKVQEAGVNNNQHIKRPSLFSGTWLEGVVNARALLNELASNTPGEAVMMVFNALFPYPKALPDPQEDEVSGLEFYGAGVYKTPRKEPNYGQDEGKFTRMQEQISAAEKHIKELEQIIAGKDALGLEMQAALKSKGNELGTLQDMLNQLKEKHQAAMKTIPSAEEVKAKQAEQDKLKEQVSFYKSKFDDCNKNLKEAVMLAESLKIELNQRPLRKDVDDLKANIMNIETDNRNLRFKAGQAFLSSLDTQEDSDPADPEVHLQDDEVLKRLEYSLFSNSPGFKERLTAADSNKDGKITKGELVKVLDALLLPPQDVIVISRLAGFRRGVPAVAIEVLASMLASREQQKRNLEAQLFSKLAEVFEKGSMSTEQAFAYIDVNKDGSINFQELSQVCDTLHLDLSREDRHGLFAVLDEDHNGTISLLELKSKLENAPPMPKQIKVVQKPVQIQVSEDVKFKQALNDKLKEQENLYKVKFEDYEKKLKDAEALVETLKNEINQSKQAKNNEDDHSLRFKAGQVFLSALENQDNSDPASPESYLQDDVVLKRLEKSLVGNSPGFKERLTAAASNKDGKVTKEELVKVLASLSLPPQDIIVISRLAGFRKGVQSVPIEGLASMQALRKQNKSKLESLLFSKLAGVFEKSSMSTDQAFTYIDVNKDGSINFQELSQVCDTLQLNLSREDRHALFAVLDEDHNGTISLLELKSRLETAPDLNLLVVDKESSTNALNTAKSAGPSKQPVKSTPILPLTDLPKSEITSTNLSGILVIGLIKGTDLGTGSYAVQLRIESVQTQLKTPALSGPSPDWKYEGRISIYGAPISEVPGEVVAEVFGDKGLVASARVPWNKSLDSPNAWALRSEYTLNESSGSKHGSLLMQLMWCPTEGTPAEGAGLLSVQVVSYSGFPKSQLQFTIGSSKVISNLEKDATALIKDLVVKKNQPISDLKCTVINAANREEIAETSLSIQTALARPDWTLPVQVQLNGDYKLALRLWWLPQTADEEKLSSAAVRIQAMFRGGKARQELTVLLKSRKKLVGRKGMSFNNKYYLLNVTEEKDNYLLELHNVDMSESPMYEVSSYLKCPKQPLGEIFNKVKVSIRNELFLEFSPQEVIHGTLGGLKDGAKRRKLIGRKGLSFNKKYYLLSIIEENDNYLLELHNANDSKAAMYDVISSLKCPKQPLDQIFQKLKISSTDKILLESNLPVEIRGPLGIEICSCTCPVKSYVRIESGTAAIQSPIGPPWVQKVVIPEVAYTQTGSVAVTLFSVEKKDELGKGLFEWGQSVKTPNTWTSDIVREIGKYSMTLKFIWSVNKQNTPESSAVPDEPQEEIKKKSLRTLLGRKGIMRNKRYYMLSIYEAAGIRQMELHVADDPNFPMYEVVDKADLSSQVTLDNLIAKLDISKDRKLIIPKNT